MKKTTSSVLLCLAMSAAFLAGSQYGQRGAATPPATEARRVLYYVDPMHPGPKFENPGIAPDCGMQLEPVYADGGPGTTMPSGVVRISPAKQQLFGVRVGTIEKSPATFKLRLFGRVAPDEARIYKLDAGIEGFIQDVSADATTGRQVTKDQLLATFAAPNATMTIQTYILNLGAGDRFQKSAAEGSVEAQSLPAATANIEQRTQQLRNLGMSALQIESIRQTRELPTEIKIVSPVDGVVLARDVSSGQKFERGKEWYQIADLSQIWILADVSASEAQYLRPGEPAQVSLPNQRKTFTATVSEVRPQFDAATRTLKARLEADNPGQVLRPGMFVDVEVPVTLAPTIAVPVDAVLDSGSKRAVFVERSEGVFEARRVETGWRFEDRVEIVEGLAPGDRIAISGTFLLDSETRMKLATAGSDATSE